MVAWLLPSRAANSTLPPTNVAAYPLVPPPLRRGCPLSQAPWATQRMCSLEMRHWKSGDQWERRCRCQTARLYLRRPSLACRASECWRWVFCSATSLLVYHRRTWDRVPRSYLLPWQYPPDKKQRLGWLVLVSKNTVQSLFITITPSFVFILNHHIHLSHLGLISTLRYLTNNQGCI